MTDCPDGRCTPAAWGRRWLIAAGIYNLVWGAVVILFPHLLFDLTGIERMRYPEVWQCVGMIVGVYGVGYLAAARDPHRHWPIVLVGLLGKIFGPIGFAFALFTGALPLAFGFTLLTNDLIWWYPFGRILWEGAKAKDALPEEPRPTLEEALDQLTDQSGRTLGQVSEQDPTLVVLTRHGGCTFCREALKDVSRAQGVIRDRGYRIAIVMQSSPSELELLARVHDLENASWFSDPERLAYRALELPRGTVGQLFGPKVWLRGAQALMQGHGIGTLAGDGFQMPGAFVIHHGEILREFRHQSAADRPNYGALACEAC